MGFGSPIHWIILGIIAIVLFGGGRFPSLMGDVANGLKSFKKGMAEDEDASTKPGTARLPDARTDIVGDQRPLPADTSRDKAVS